MSTYKEPIIEIEQQFAAGVSNTYLPELRACIIAPFYDIVDKESSGAYVGVEKECEFLSPYTVDIRAKDPNEIAFPIAVTLKDSYEKVGEFTAGTAGTSEFDIGDTSPIFTYPQPLDKQVWVEFTGGMYHHFTRDVELEEDGFAWVKFDGGTGTVPANGTVLKGSSGAAGTTVAVYDRNMTLCLDGATMPTSGYISLTAAGHVAWVDDEEVQISAGSVKIAVSDGASGLGYFVKSSAPVFYNDTDYTSEYVSQMTLAQSLIVEQVEVLHVNSRYEITAFAPTPLTLVPGPCGPSYIERTDLLPIEKEARRIRSTTSPYAARLYNAKSGVSYMTIKFDLYEVGTRTILQSEFDDWGMTLNSNGVTLPFDMSGPDGQVVSQADVYLTYRALRTNYANAIESCENTSDITEKFGNITKYNTGAYMLYLALANAKGRPVFFTGLESSYITAPTVAFGKALEYLEDKRVYALAYASLDPQIHTLVSAHVAKCSLAENHGWRIGLNVHVMAQYKELIESSTTSQSPFDAYYHNGFSGGYFCDEQKSFISEGVISGHDIYITGWEKIVPTAVGTCVVGPGNTSVIDGTWGTASTAISISAVTLPLGFSVSDLRGRTVKLTFSDSNYDTSVDTGVYSDNTRTENISTNQKYSELGYRVISANHVSGTLTLYLYTVNTSVASPDGAVVTGIVIHDGPLSNRDESAIKNHYITVATVESDEVLSCEFKLGWKGIYTGVTYEIRKEYNNTEKATAYSAYTSAFSDRRMNWVYPYEYIDSDGDTLPGYFIAAGEAGWIGGSYPHQPITSQALQGYYRLLHSNKEFGRKDLNIIAGGGVSIYTQEADNAGAICRHQLTSDMESVLTQENSVTRSVDIAAYLLWDNLNPLKGNYNISDDIFTVITTKINACRIILCDKKYSRYGSILKTFIVNILEQDKTAQDGVYLEMEVETQKPFNRMRVLVKVK